MPFENESGKVIQILIIEPSTGTETDLASQLTFDGREDLVRQTVPTLAEARLVLADERVDCVVTRHSPPTVDGVEILSELRIDNPDLPILLSDSLKKRPLSQQRETHDSNTARDSRLSNPRPQDKSRCQQIAATSKR